MTTGQVALAAMVGILSLVSALCSGVILLYLRQIIAKLEHAVSDDLCKERRAACPAATLTPEVNEIYTLLQSHSHTESGVILHAR